jgi:hypothetical protein
MTLVPLDFVLRVMRPIRSRWLMAVKMVSFQKSLSDFEAWFPTAIYLSFDMDIKLFGACLKSADRDVPTQLLMAGNC